MISASKEMSSWAAWHPGSPSHAEEDSAPTPAVSVPGPSFQEPRPLKVENSLNREQRCLKYHFSQRNVLEKWRPEITLKTSGRGWSLCSFSSWTRDSDILLTLSKGLPWSPNHLGTNCTGPLWHCLPPGPQPGPWWVVKELWICPCGCLCASWMIPSYRLCRPTWPLSRPNCRTGSPLAISPSPGGPETSTHPPFTFNRLSDKLLLEKRTGTKATNPPCDISRSQYHPPGIEHLVCGELCVGRYSCSLCKPLNNPGRQAILLPWDSERTLG